MGLVLKENNISTGQTMPREGAKEMLPTLPEFPLMSHLLNLQHETQDFVHRENCGSSQFVGKPSCFLFSANLSLEM